MTRKPQKKINSNSDLQKTETQMLGCQYAKTSRLKFKASEHFKLPVSSSIQVSWTTKSLVQPLNAKQTAIKRQ